MSDYLIWFYRISAGTEGQRSSGPLLRVDWLLFAFKHPFEPDSPEDSFVSKRVNYVSPPQPLVTKKEICSFFQLQLNRFFLFSLGVGRECLAEVTVLIRHYLRPITKWLFAKWHLWTERLDSWRVEIYSSASHPQLFSEKQQWLRCQVTNPLWLRFLWIQISPRWLFSPNPSLCSAIA